MEDVRTDLKAANVEVAELSSKLKDKESEIRSYAKRVVDLERRVRQLGNEFAHKVCFECYYLFSH